MTPHPTIPNLTLITEVARPTLHTEGVETTPTVRIYADPNADPRTVLEALIGSAYKMLNPDPQ